MAEEEGPILRRRRQYLIVRVDRTDLSKNTLRGFKAFDLFLDRHPEYLEDITFFALLQPSRQDVDEYIEYLARIRDVVSHINTKHGTTDWMPIDLRIESNIHRAVARLQALRRAHGEPDLRRDEPDRQGGAARQRARRGDDPVRERGRPRGARRSFAITINPFDIEDQAEALHQALVMPADERAFRIQEIKRIVRENDVGKWLAAQQADIARKRTRRPAARQADGGR